ncbi:Uncharacterized protein TPAR_00568 [Tolypocladium paradoxum]|uniref:Glycosyl transferase CAP10 domain-containing protein n=1 Tax=Tolypocladium paradoxum TaxID=94208 RepID=A0A2S4L9Z0_9HYPO|nr:Uncharacterized protein TPAR_00568 [Tolypocladium paradoxum]
MVHVQWTSWANRRPALLVVVAVVAVVTQLRCCSLPSSHSSVPTLASVRSSSSMRSGHLKARLLSPSASRHLCSMSPAGAALLCAALAQHLVSRNVELPSELLCWAILPALVRVTRRHHRCCGTGNTLLVGASRSVTSPLAFVFALGVAAACWYRAEEHIVVLFPALTPLLLLSGVRSAAAHTTDSRLLGPSVTTRWGSGLVAAFSCLALVQSNGTGLLSLGVCVFVVAFLYGGYLAVSRSAVDGGAEDTSEGKGHDDAAGGIDVEGVVLPCALRILPALAVAMGLRTLVLHEPNGPLGRAVMVGFVKALAWFFTIKATRHSSWCVATTIGTFAMTSTRSPFSQLSDLRAASNLVASLLSLGQTIHMLPKGVKSRSTLWALCLLPLAPLLANMYAIHASTTSLPQGNHPIEALARAAEAEFVAMLRRQSRSYTAAEAEYRRRYGMSPPAGFEAWYDYAVACGSPIIDEFDIIHEAVAPFLKMSGRRVREAMREASGADMWTCEFRGETGETRCRHAWRTFDRHLGETFGKMLGDVKGVLPDVEFLVNHLDEPRVMLPGAESTDAGGWVTVTDLSRRPVWDVLTRNCPQGVSNTSSGVETVVNTYGVPFVADTRADKDLCRHPEYRDMYGMAMSPVSFLLVDGAVPVLSTGKPSTMGDVLFPSPAYEEAEFVYDEGRDVAWDRKRNKLYWAGSTTGAYASDEGWKRHHRQRFVALAQGLESGREHWFLRERDGLVHRVASTFLNSRLFDVAFTRIFQCRAGACGAQRTYFDARPWADKDAALRSRLVFDGDGNGISGRFAKLLASRSAPLKQTLLREWHDERLAAWVHYVPVSQGLGELPELVAWLTGTEAGRRRARRVADGGREWAARGMRGQDRGVYMYRLMLELSRVQDPAREAV